MRGFVESFRRIYLSGKKGKEEFEARRKAGQITQEEYDYIVNDDQTPKARKKSLAGVLFL